MSLIIPSHSTPEDEGITMRAVTLMFHDVWDSTVSGTGRASGIRGDRYTLRVQEFTAHMASLRTALCGAPALASDPLPAPSRRPAVMLTFDDGRVSAYMTVMDVLERYGWKAHFFIVTDWIGTPQYMNAAQLRALHARGHVIGSHSCSHPSMISSLSRERMTREWSDSRTRLSDILGDEVITASVPGGYYSHALAEAASGSGIRVLFTSEPTSRSYMVGRCRVFGRYVISAGTRPARVAGLIQGRRIVRVMEHLTWDLKKSARNLGGTAYLKLRSVALERSSAGAG